MVNKNGRKKGDIVITPTSVITENAKSLGIDEKDYIEKMITDGFVLYVQETEKNGKDEMKYISFKNSPNNIDNKPTSLVEATECRRLRKEFPPITRAVNFLKSYYLCSGVDVKIDEPTDSIQKTCKEDLTSFIEDVSQDVLTQGLDSILDIMLDECITVGPCAAEIVYDKDIDFIEYAEPALVNDPDTNGSVEGYITKEPNWKEDGLIGIQRLKIIDNTFNRIRIYRDNKWNIHFFTIDERNPTQQTIVSPSNYSSIAMQGAMGGKNTQTIVPLKDVVKLLPWQMFYLTLNRQNWSEKSDGTVKSVMKIAVILEKIYQAMGEGMWRAGNKKYFIITGTEKRQWNDIAIINVVKKVNEMAEKNVAAIPVPAGFDIKEMGGQVFQGTEIVDHFCGLIAEGMDVPFEVVTNTKVSTNDNPWQASMVTIRRKQVMLENLIRTQLFSRHIWCMHGINKTQQSGRSTKKIFIPKVKWKRIDALDQMSVQQHLDVIYKALNVANPLSTMSKFAFERDLNKIMGFDTVLLPSDEEIKKEYDERNKLQMDIQKLNLEKAKAPPEPIVTTENKPIGEIKTKEQGQPEAPTEDKQKKRLDNGVSKMDKETQSQKGIAKDLGATRNPIA